MSDDMNKEQVAAEKAAVEELLIGEGKRYRDAVEASKALSEKDSYIRQLKEKMEELEQAANKARTVDDVVKELKSSMGNRSNEDLLDSQEEATKGSETPTLTDSDIKARVAAEIERYSAQQREAENVNRVVSTLRERYGEDYDVHLERTASSLGVGKDFLVGLAKQSPNLVLSYFNQNAPKHVAGDRSGINTEAQVAGNMSRPATFEEFMNTQEATEIFQKGVRAGDTRIISKLKALAESKGIKL